MHANLVSRASRTMPSSRAEVWEALVSPEAIKQYMFGTEAVSDWREGSPIEWKGQWEGKPYADKGTLLKAEPGRILRYSHYSPLSGMPDLPENRHTVTWELKDAERGTEVVLTQDNNKTEEARLHSEKNWEKMLAALEGYLSRTGGTGR